MSIQGQVRQYLGRATGQNILATSKFSIKYAQAG